MRKIKTFLFLLFLLSGVVACHKAPSTCQITGQLSSKRLDSKMIYLRSKNRVGKPLICIDSVLVQKQNFSFSEDVDTICQVYLFSDNTELGSFFLESGVVNITVEEGQDGTYALTASGTPLNDEYRNYSQMVQKAKEEHSTRVKKLFDDKTLSAPEKVIKEDSLYGIFESQMAEMIQRFYVDNKTNILAPIFFLDLGRYAKSQILVELFEENSSKYIQEDSRCKTLYDKMKNNINTQKGQQYVDFEAIQPDGSVLCPSQFRKDGAYFIIDFWATWCPPCRASIPVLQGLYKKYQQSNLVMLSVCSRDKAENYIRSEQDEHDILWHSIFDKESVGIMKYGSQGIPDFVLIDPSGKIILRTHNVLELQQSLEILQKDGLLK